MKSKSFVFLGDKLDIQNKTKAIKLFEDYMLKRANQEQIAYIRKFLDNYSKISLIQSLKFEYDTIKKEGGGFIHTRLDQDKWDYWVIEYSRVQSDGLFSLTLALSILDFTIFFDAVYSNIQTTNGIDVPGFIHRQLSIINFLLDSGIDINVKRVTTLEINEIRNIHKQLKLFDSIKREYDFIDKALKDFEKLKDISVKSPFRILNYFSILELLLTNHSQKSYSDTSISYQLKKKINLINNLADNKINFQDYFKGSDTNTLELIIEKLYKYRNDIAHGNKSDFENELQIFKNQKKNIIDFLHILLRNILIEAIKNPRLFKDLKEC